MLAEARQAMAAQLNAKLLDVQVSAYALSNYSLPYGQVVPAATEYDAAMARGADWWTFTVTILVSDNAGDMGAQMLLDSMIEPSGGVSVKAALEADTTLGGVVDALRVRGCSGYRIYQTAGRAPELGAEWDVQVLAEGGAS